ncbi:FAD-binding oxidoreductase [bacterium]|nr:FAD-binding oxidoreductase [bacterium]
MNTKNTSNFDSACEQWKNLLGDTFVHTNKDNIKSYEETTFETDQSIAAIIQPDTHEKVRQCVEIAKENNVTIYPVSRGKNWGLGSFVPPQSNCTLVDLGKMDKIINYNDELGYITVEPGVTFSQVSKYLKKKNSKRYLSVIGGSPDASLIGNMVERGDSSGPFGDRLQHCCNMKVVLPTGETIHTGFGRYGESTSSNIHRYGVGPAFDGIFTQSNLGIVTQATFWLPLKPAHFQVVLFTLQSDKDLEKASETLRDLMDEGVISPYSAVVWNRHKFLAWETQYPWDLTGEKTPLSSSIFDKVSGPFKGINWFGLVGIYSASKAHAKADKALIKKRLKPYSKGFFTINKTTAQICSIFKKPLNWLAKKDIASIVDTLYNDSIFLGNPTQKSVKGMYWRKRFPIPDNPHPERDKCGALWLCPTVPFTQNDLMSSINLMRDYLAKHSYEPIIAMTFPSSRSIYFLPVIVYDREQEGEDTRAMRCHDEMLQAFIEKKCFPHRLGIQSMKSLPEPNDSYLKFLETIKNTIDPAKIMSPGRYDFDKKS